jgi:hypothetical protein
MEVKRILIIGSGHLAGRLKKLAEAKGYSCAHIHSPHLRTDDDGNTIFRQATALLREHHLAAYDMAYLVDDKDETNLQFIIALMGMDSELRVTATLFNENIAPHLQAAYPRLRILNPARIAAPAFVESLYAPVGRTLRYEPVRLPAVKRKAADLLIWTLVAGFSLLIILSTMYVHFAEGYRWLDASYFVVVTVASVGYGDISLLHSSDMSKLLNIVLILGAMVFIWMIFSLLIDRIIKKRIQLSMGQKKYAYTNHVIVCGLGRLGYCVVEELIRKGEKVIVVESDENSTKADQLRQQGIDVYTGNARSFAVLNDLNVLQARALISVIDNDYVNLEIALNARSLRPDLRLILRVFDETMARQVSEDLDIHLTLSMSALADEQLLSLMDRA